MTAEPAVHAVIDSNIHKVVAKRGGGSTEASTAAAVVAAAVVAAAVVVAIPATLPSTSSPSSSYSLHQLMREQSQRLKPLQELY